MKNNKKMEQTNYQDKKQPIAVDLERKLGESPTPDQEPEANLNAQKTEAVINHNPAIEDRKTEVHVIRQNINTTNPSELPAKRNSAQQSSPDVIAQNWSAKQLAEESPYEDETLIKAKIKTGKNVRAKSAA